MISLISVVLIVFYLYSAVYVYMLNHCSNIKRIFLLIEINLTITFFANYMLVNASSYANAYFWMKLYRYLILPIPLLLLAGVLLLVFQDLEKKIQELLLIFGIAIPCMWALEFTPIGDASFTLYQSGMMFRWQIQMDTLPGILFNLLYILLFIPSAVLGTWAIQMFLAKKYPKYLELIRILAIAMMAVILIGVLQFYIIAKDGLYDGIFYFIMIGLPISLAYFLVVQERKLPLAMMDSYAKEIVNSLSEGVLMVDENFQVHRFNDFAERLFEWERGKTYALACDWENYEAVAQEILFRFQSPLFLDSFLVEVDCGVGIAKEEPDKKDIHRMILESDLAANQAIRYGNQKYYLYSDEMDSNRSAEFSMLNDYLYAALLGDELFIRYELKWDKQGNAVGLIAGICWKVNSEREMKEKEIIEIAEMYNFTQELERWRRKRLIWDMKYLYSKEKLMLPVTIRLMKSTFYNEENLQDLLKNMEENKVEKQYMEFALGEEIFKQATTLINTCLTTIRSHEIKVGLKNFGGLHSSLKYLRDLEIDFIILDPEFVNGIGINPTDEAILRMILDLAKNMRYRVLAFNISRKEQLEFLGGDCHEVSGSYFMPAQSMQELCESLRESRELVEAAEEGTKELPGK